MRRIVTVATTVGVVAISILAGVTPANAAAVPPSVMPDCYETDPPERGGWSGGRDVIAQGTFATDDADVRGRTARFGEPCWGMGTLSLPVQVTDLPVDALDEDGDGEDDGAPLAPGAGECNYTIGSGVEIQPSIVNTVDGACNKVPVTTARFVSGPGWQYAHRGYVQVELNLDQTTPRVIVSPAQRDAVVALGYPNEWVGPGSFPGNYYSLSGVCKNTTTNALQHGGGGYNVGPESAGSTRTLTFSACPSGTTLYAIYALSYRNSYDSSLPIKYYGVLWRSDNLEVPDPSEGTGYYGGTQEAPILVAPLTGVNYEGVSTDEPSLLWCSNAYDGGTLTSHVMMPIRIQSGFGYYPPPGNGDTPEWTVNLELFPAVEDPSFTTADCPFIDSISVMICTWQGNGPDTGSCAQYLWDADAWREHRGYTGSDGQPPGGLLCTIYPQAPGCYEVINPPYVDGTDFAQVCGNAPAFTAPGWDNFGNWVPALLDWVGASIGHYSECLFIPINGWDRDGVVEAAWQDSPIGQVNDIVTGTFSRVSSMTGTCGTIVDVVLFDTPVVIDTCSWTWAVPMRNLLQWALLALGGFAIAGFLVNTTLSLIKAGPTPNPVDGGKK